MAESKKQMLRLRRFVGQLKENRYPNRQSFVADLERSDRELNQSLTCSVKTIQRDIKFLQNELKCPIDFDYRHNGYYLKHHGWNLDMLQLLSENEMLAAVLGARVAENIFPEPLRSDIRNSVDAQLAENNPDFLDKTIVKSLTIIPGLRVSINPEIFMTVFSAWQKHEALDIVYNDLSGRGTSRRVEPHALVYYECSWYFKGFCLLRNEVRNFAVHRITQAVKTGLFFDPDNKIIDRVLNDQFLD
ncbi:MAG: WYL domain-containing protein, partial [Victivallaceae bacterium]